MRMFRRKRETGVRSQESESLTFLSALFEGIFPATVFSFIETGIVQKIILTPDS